MAAIYRPVVAKTAISFETIPPSPEEMGRRIAEAFPAYPWLVCDIAGAVVGYAYASRHRVRAAYRWSVDTSVYVDPSRRRSGIGRGLYLSLFAVLAAQGYFNAFAGITLPNPASTGLHESMGFVKIGVYHRVGYKLGAWHDVGWWAIRLQEHERQPEEPLSPSDVRAQADWNTRVSRGEPLISA